MSKDDAQYYSDEVSAMNLQLQDAHAELESLRATVQALVDALWKAEDYMTSTGSRIGPGCLCNCPVIDGHTADCPILPAMRLAATKHNIKPSQP